MQVVKPTKAGINQAVAVLKKGGVIIYPTDTAYALGGIFNSKKVVGRILKIKNRKDSKFTVIAANPEQVKKNFSFNKNQQNLAKKYWPGPFSIVVSPRFAVRVPKNSISQNLAKKVGQPLIATSANISGKSAFYHSQSAIKEFINKKNQPDLILAAGLLAKRKTSTIVKVFPKKIEIIRNGSVKLS
ncbi:MAG: L-threonylcarbamoyladenylate synthase [Patescibacteria group bacterium]